MARQLRQAYLSTLITLVVQFLLGMATNLFVDIPTSHPGARAPEYFGGVFQSVTWAILQGPSLLLTAHAVLGLLLVLSGFTLVYRAAHANHRPTLVTSIIGAVAVLGAGFNGGSFLNYNEDFSSMIMASFFAIAVVAYAVGLWALPQELSLDHARSTVGRSASGRAE